MIRSLVESQQPDRRATPDAESTREAMTITMRTMQVGTWLKTCKAETREHRSQMIVSRLYYTAVRR